jgi:hypothetical protein
MPLLSSRKQLFRWYSEFFFLCNANALLPQSMLEHSIYLACSIHVNEILQYLAENHLKLIHFFRDLGGFSTLLWQC